MQRRSSAGETRRCLEDPTRWARLGVRSGKGRQHRWLDRAKDASLLFIWGMAFNSDDGKISRRDFNPPRGVASEGVRMEAKREAVPAIISSAA